MSDINIKEAHEKASRAAQKAGRNAYLASLKEANVSAEDNNGGGIILCCCCTIP